MNRSLTMAATCALAAASTATWHTKHPLPEGIAGGTAGLFRESPIYAGGTTWRDGHKLWLTTVHRYDAARDTWAAMPPLPEPLAYGPYAITDSGPEIFGGANETGASWNCWRLHRSAGRWEPSGRLPYPSALGRVAAIGKRVYLFGGCPDTADLTGCTDSIAMRDEQGLWSAAGKLPSGPIALAASAVLGEDVYLFGGCAPQGPGKIHNLTQAWRFHTATHQWQALQPLPAATRGIAAIALDRTHILLAGGYTATQDEAKLHGPEFGFTPAALLYDTARDRYTTIAPLPIAAAGIELVRAHRKIFGIGGEDKARSRSALLMELQLPL